MQTELPGEELVPPPTVAASRVSNAAGRHACAASSRRGAAHPSASQGVSRVPHVLECPSGAIAIVAGTLAAGIVVPLLRWHALFEAIGAGVVIVIGSRLLVDVVLRLCRVR
jgi:hypothetical protein